MNGVIINNQSKPSVSFRGLKKGKLANDESEWDGNICQCTEMQLMCYSQPLNQP